MNENGPGKRQAFLSEKRIEGEKYPAILSDRKISQAPPARPIAGGHFAVGWVPVAG